MDATTLGKIEMRGADAGEFLNRIYTNAFKKLAPGSARYGVMCTADGMIFDDGVTLRLDEDRYFMTTTTGGAARVLDWLEEWHQTEWPELDVAMTSVTEQWTTVAVVGPKSRAVIARLAPDLDVSQEAFGFMTFRETVLASGIPARVCRISFSGELAFEVNVSGWFGQQVWEDIVAAGDEFGITPYGTETMHVLRAEKGYPIVGQDTDGSVTPQDAGMAWAVSKLKDFVGKRSFSRTDTAREDRKHLVSVLPADPSLRLPEGSQLIEHDRGGRGVRAGADAGPRHLQLPQCRARSFVRAGADQERPQPDRRDADRRVRRSPRRRGRRRDRALRPRREAPRWLSLVLESPRFAPGLRPVSPAAHLARRFAQAEVTGARGVSLRELPFLTQVGLRVVPGTAAAGRIESRLGMSLPRRYGQVGTGDRLVALWLSPDEFLLVSTLPATELVAGAGRGAGRRPRLGVDLSANRTTLELAGPSARAVLEKGCPLDLHPRAFAAGSAYG